MNRRSELTTKISAGFTVVEILVIAPIVILIIGAFISAIVYMTGDVMATRSANKLFYDVQDALNRIEEDISQSQGFLATNNILISSPQGIDDATTDFKNATSTNSALILNSFATTENPLSSIRTLVFKSEMPNACTSSLVNQNTPMMTNVVYFVDEGSLYRRVIMDSDYETSGCIGTSIGAPWQKPTCSTGNVSGFCKSEETPLIQGVTSFDISYFTEADQTNEVTNASDSSQTDETRQTALQTTPIASIELSATTTAAGRSYSYASKTRASSPNTSILTTPSAPTSLSATGGTGQISLSWTAPGKNGNSAITGYRIYRGNDSNNMSLLTTVGNVTSYVDTPLELSQTRYYKVAAVNSFGYSAFSNTSNATTDGLFAATGGTVSYDGDYKIHTFTSSDTLVVTSGGNVEILVVGGGGGGGGSGSGWSYSGGGGAGGVVHQESFSVTTGSHAVTVGSGGSQNSDGNDSTFSTLIAYGGGSGSGPSAATSGGSGGGSRWANFTIGGGMSGQGHDGGNASLGDGGSAGGGGAGAVGGSPSPGAYCANGGIGVSDSITGSAVYYGGGGGGGGQSSYCSGGNGGGGRGGYVSIASGAAGTSGTGGGGGGAYIGGSGGNGGYGIVIIRYKYQ